MRVLGGLFFFMWCGAIVSHVVWKQAPLQGVGSASFLLLAGGLVLLSADGQERKELILAGLIGFAAEVLGVQYGWLFGQYRYTKVLAPNWLGTPVVMICAWFILIGYVKQMLLRFHLSTWLEVILGATWMTVIDLLIDPLAAHPFKFWNWIEAGSYYGIPLRNFVGWFVVSAAILALHKLIFKTRSRENAWMQLIGVSIIVLYTACAFGYGYYGAGVVGSGLGMLHLALFGAQIKGVLLNSTAKELTN